MALDHEAFITYHLLNNMILEASGVSRWSFAGDITLLILLRYVRLLEFKARWRHPAIYGL